MENLIIVILFFVGIYALDRHYEKYRKYKEEHDKKELEEEMIKQGRIYHFIYKPYKIDGYYDYETFKGLNDMVIGDCAHNMEYYVSYIGTVEVLTDYDRTVDYEKLRGITVCKRCGSFTDAHLFIDNPRKYKCYRCHDGEDFDEEEIVDLGE